MHDFFKKQHTKKTKKCYTEPQRNAGSGVATPLLLFAWSIAFICTEQCFSESIAMLWCVVSITLVLQIN